jgi:cation diffusion facilitator family transporter
VEARGLGTGTSADHGLDEEVLDQAARASSPEAPAAERFAAVSRVLLQVFFLNLAVAVAKIAFGYASGALSILSDGFHSLTDAGSNIVGLVGVRVARRPPDEDHPYGHRKYETVAAAGVTAGLLLVMLEILRNAFNHLTGRSAPPDISTAGFLIMLVTVAINLWVVRYESGEARRLNSEVLLADALQTRGDVWTSFAVIVALAGARLGWPIFDPIAAIVVSGFIGYAGIQIATTTTRILSDRIVISEADLEAVVMSVPEVLGCHHIRTRGSADHVFLDLHVWLDAETPLKAAHALSHVVKDRLMARYPQIADAIIHIEPPPRG